MILKSRQRIPGTMRLGQFDRDIAKTAQQHTTSMKYIVQFLKQFDRIVLERSARSANPADAVALRESNSDDCIESNWWKFQDRWTGLQSCLDPEKRQDGSGDPSCSSRIAGARDVIPAPVDFHAIRAPRQWSQRRCIS